MACAQRARVAPRRPRGHHDRMFTAVKLLVTSGAYPGHSLPVGGVPVRRPLIGLTCDKFLPTVNVVCGRLGATRARCAPASAPQARMASRRRKPPAYRIICARSARVYAEYHALYAKAPHCCRRYKHSLSKTATRNSTKRFHNLYNIMETGPQVSVYSASMPEVRTDMWEGVSRAPFSDLFRLLRLSSATAL